jgi:hypothetical protein
MIPEDRLSREVLPWDVLEVATFVAMPGDEAGQLDVHVDAPRGDLGADPLNSSSWFSGYSAPRRWRIRLRRS